MEVGMEDLISSGLAGIEIFSRESEAEAKTRKLSSRWKKKALKKKVLKKKAPKKKQEKKPAPPPYHEVSTEKPKIICEEDVIPGYRGLWDSIYAREFGSFDDQTTLGPMRHTFGPIPRYAIPDCTVQIFYIQVDEINKGGLQWPLDVHGFVAARDSVDHNRNFLFNRTRDNCQTLTQEDPYLLLTGPSRAIVMIDPIAFEFQLKVKSKTEPEKDQLLASTILKRHVKFNPKDVLLVRKPCKRCTVDFAYASLLPSVEATVSVQVVDGTSWPDCFRGYVIARTTSIKEGRMVLRDGRLPMMVSSSTGEMELSRRVVSLDLNGGELVVSVQVSEIGKDATDFVAQAEAGFKPKRAGTSHSMCDLGFCKLRVTIAWSLLSTLTDLRLDAKQRVC